MTDKEDKIKLFESDEDEEDSKEEDNHDDFKIRPEYEGPHGLQMLEMNSQLSKRFKLDERFVEDYPKVEEENTSEVNEERKKHMKILESILGHEVSKPAKSVDKSFSKKQFIRFDPDDENASQFIKKTPENIKVKPKKTKRKRETVEEKPEEDIPISTERYMEVDPNLKDILNSSAPFSFSHKFNFDHQDTTFDSKNDPSPKVTEEIEIQHAEKPKENKLLFDKEIPSSESFPPKSKYNKFFITEDDPRLKEGIEFFKRPKPLEELRVEWQKRRERVMEMFRMKKRSSQRSYTTKVQTVQMKNMIRRNNFRR